MNLRSALLLTGVFFSVPAGAVLSVSSPVSMNFSSIEYSSGGGQNNAELATNGAISYTGNFSGDGAGTPGEILMSDDLGIVVDIACNDSLVLSDGTNTVTIDQVEYVIGTANGTAYGAGQSCAGIAQFDESHVITTNPSQDTLLVGGRIRTSVSNITDGTWQTTNSGGSGVTFSIVVQ